MFYHLYIKKTTIVEHFLIKNISNDLIDLFCVTRIWQYNNRLDYLQLKQRIASTMEDIFGHVFLPSFKEWAINPLFVSLSLQTGQLFVLIVIWSLTNASCSWNYYIYITLSVWISKYTASSTTLLIHVLICFHDQRS